MGLRSLLKKQDKLMEDIELLEFDIDHCNANDDIRNDRMDLKDKLSKVRKKIYNELKKQLPIYERYAK